MLAQNNHKLKQSATKKKKFYLHVSSLYVTALLISPIHKELNLSPPPILPLACTSAHTMTSEVLETKFVFQRRDLQWRTCLSSGQKAVNFHNSQTHMAGLQPFIISLDIAYFFAATVINSATKNRIDKVINKKGRGAMRHVLINQPDHTKIWKKDFVTKQT